MHAVEGVGHLHGERLLDKDVLARQRRFLDEPGVGFGPDLDEHRVDGLVAQDLLVVGGRVLPPVLGQEGFGFGVVEVAVPHQLGPRDLSQIRAVHPGRHGPAPDHTEVKLL